MSWVSLGLYAILAWFVLEASSAEFSNVFSRGDPVIAALKRRSRALQVGALFVVYLLVGVVLIQFDLISNTLGDVLFLAVAGGSLLILIWARFGRAKISENCFPNDFDFVKVELLQQLLPNGLLTVGRRYEGISASHRFLVFQNGSQTLLVTPVQYWHRSDKRPTMNIRPWLGRYSTGATASINVSASAHETATRSPALSLHLEGGRVFRIRGMDPAVCDTAVETCMLVLDQDEPEYDAYTAEDEDFAEQGSDFAEDPVGDHEAKAWHEILGVPPDASRDAIVAAYREKIKKCHSDKVDGLDPEIQELAKRKSTELNLAKAEGLRRSKPAA